MKTIVSNRQIALFLFENLMIAISFAQTPPTKEWDANFGGSVKDPFTTVIQTSDNGYLLGGHTFSSNSGDVTFSNKGFADFWIVKADETGTMLWSIGLGGDYSDACWGMQETNDGGYILVGYTGSGVSGDVSEPSRGATWD